ncbi:MAG TPA: hypothetical protein VGP28_04570 [Methylocella sp.]|jgi:hypothetical protein|nr:hypothetical protein [Methylocella sp.]
MQDDRIETGLKIRMLEKRLADLKGAGRGKSSGGKSGGGEKGSAFKPPKAGKVPSGKGGGGRSGGVKVFKGGGKSKSPKTPEPRPVAAQQRELVSAGKDVDASRRFLPAGGGHRSGPKKRKA